MDNSDPYRALEELLSTMHRLRAPGGCPWDAKQTPDSLLPYLLEEACEVIEAIEAGHLPAIVDELGDLLLQIVFQAEIFSERGLFDFADVAAAINRKLLHRHPHVFAVANSSKPDSAEELSSQWERLKEQEQSAHSAGERHPLGILPGRLPALQRAQKLLTRARRRGVVINQVPIIAPLHPQTGEELGEQLFQLVRHAEELGLDAESALRQTIRRVSRRPMPRPCRPGSKQILSNNFLTGREARPHGKNKKSRCFRGVAGFSTKTVDSLLITMCLTSNAK